MVHAYLDAVKPRTLNPTITHQGGVAHQIDHWARLNRFLILGSEGGSYYVGERDLTLENVACVCECLADDAIRTIATIEEISHNGRAPKNDPAILALTMATLHDDPIIRKQAFKALPNVCRTGTHLLHFVAFREALEGGWGRGMRRAVGQWFTAKKPRDLAYQAVKYPSRDGWALSDLLRLSHPKMDEHLSWVAKYIVDGEIRDDEFTDTTNFLRACQAVSRPGMYNGIATTVRENRIPREAVATVYLNDPYTWDALLADMPMTAMIRNLGKMTSVGLIRHGSDAERKIVDELQNAERLKKARVHPLALLVALKVYEQGHGEKGSLTWSANKRVANALDEAFYLAFGALESTGKRLCVALDISGSMDWHKIAGMLITPRMASAAMALVTVAVEPEVQVVAFSHDIRELAIRPSMRLDDVLRTIDGLPAGYTLPELPMRWARETRTVFDGFVTYTDNQTGSQHPVWDELRHYRASVKKNARHAVVAMEANEFSIADPDDPGQLDVVGFDTATPAILSNFFAGRF